MISVSQEEFESLVDRAIQALPKAYLDKIKNVAFIVEDDPSEKQRVELN